MKRTLTTLLALAACAAGAAPAAAGDDYESASTIKTFYSVVIEGEAYYNVARITPTEFGDQTHQEDDQFKFRTEIPDINFWDEIGSDSTRSLGKGTGVRGHLTTINPSGARLECDGSTVTEYQAGRLVGELGSKATIYKVRVLEAIQMAMDCPGIGTYPKRFDSLNAEVGTGLWDDEFTVHQVLIGEDEMRFPISNKVTGPDCPGFDEETTICELSWTAEVVFKKTGWSDVQYGYDTEGNDTRTETHHPVDPQPQPQPAPAPAPQPAPPAFDTPPGAKLGAAAVTVPVSCATGCTGTATVTLAGGKARAAAAAKPIARKAFTVAPGATKRVKVTIPKRARKAVRRAGGVKVTLAVKPTGGVRTTKRLLVRR